MTLMECVSWKFLRLPVVVILAASLAADSKGGDADMTVTMERHISGPDALGGCFRDMGIEVSKTDGKVRLAPVEYIVDAVGNKVSGKARFSEQRSGKKSFDLGKAGAQGGDVLIFSIPQGVATWNGKPLALSSYEHTGGWQKGTLAKQDLKDGINELILQSGFTLEQDAETKPAKNSFDSSDGGKTWIQATNGEFLVRLRLKRHPAKGVIWSDVVDLAAFLPGDGLLSALSGWTAHMDLKCETPKGTALLLECRSGGTARPDSTWSEWGNAKGDPKPNRYVQWRATMTTEDRSVTPVLAGVEIIAKATVVADAAGSGVKLVEITPSRTVRSSCPYPFQRPSAKLERLRREFKLDEVVAAGKTDIEKLLLLRNWVRRRWPCNDMGSGVRTWDALEILTAGDNQHGMCVHFGTVFYQCALALGFNARPVILTNHYVADVWVNEFRRWVLMDVESVQPEGFRSYGTAHYVNATSGVPMSVMELHREVHAVLRKGENSVPTVIQKYTVDTNNTLHAEMDKVRSPKELRIFERFAYPERNNYLDRLEPWEEFHGQDYYHSDAHLWWLGETERGQEQEFSRRTDREGDLMWTVNEVDLTLTASTRPASVDVTAVTVTPNFKEFMCRKNGGEWSSVPAPGSDPDERVVVIAWDLKPGENTLEIKPMNMFGREGLVSKAVVRFTTAK